MFMIFRSPSKFAIILFHSLYNLFLILIYNVKLIKITSKLFNIYFNYLKIFKKQNIRLCKNKHKSILKGLYSVYSYISYIIILSISEYKCLYLTIITY